MLVVLKFESYIWKFAIYIIDNGFVADKGNLVESS